MKKVAAIFLISILLFSCKKEVKKPDNLLSEKKMEDIFYDLALLQVMNTFSQKTLDENDIVANKYIYEKYKIDSVTFVQNQTYYAQNLEMYKRIQGKVTERLKKEKTLVDTLVVKEAKLEEKKNMKPVLNTAK